MKVLLAAPGHSYSTRGWVEGLNMGLTAVDTTVVPFNYRFAIRFYEMSLPVAAQEFPTFRAFCSDVDQFDMAVKSLASDRLAVSILENLPLDAIAVVNGTLYNPKVYSYLRSLSDAYGVPWGIILTESPYEDDDQVTLLKGASFATSNDFWSVQRLQDQLVIPVLYLPASYDPVHWYWSPSGIQQDYELDWCFVGSKFPEREEMLSELITASHEQGLAYELYWAGAESNGWLDHDELRTLYRRARVCINIHRTSKDIRGSLSPYIAYSLNPRAYEIAAAGAFQVSDYRPELWSIFGETVPTWRTPGDLRDLVLSAVRDDSWRRKCVAEAYHRVQPHSYVQRAKALTSFLQEEVL